MAELFIKKVRIAFTDSVHKRSPANLSQQCLSYLVTNSIDFVASNKQAETFLKDNVDSEE